MRILLSLHHYLDPNQGAPGATLLLGSAMAQLGNEVEFFGFDEAFPKGGKSSIRMAVEFPWKLNSFLKKRASNFDVLDLSTGDNWVWASSGRVNAKKIHALVTRSHGLEHVVNDNLWGEVKAGRARVSWKYPFYHGGIRLFEVARSLRLADMSVLLNSYDRNYVINRLKVRPEKTALTAAGMADPFLGLTPRGPKHPENGNINIAFVGTYIDRKGIKYLGAALRKILDKHPSVTVGFFGVGCAPEAVLADFDRAFHSRICVVQRYEKQELPVLLKDYEIHIFPSLSEGFPVSVLESMACGLVPIVTDIPGPTEFCHNLRNALVVPPRDSEALVDAFEHLISDPELTERLRAAAFVESQKYSWARIASETLLMYEGLLSK